MNREIEKKSIERGRKGGREKVRRVGKIEKERFRKKGNKGERE